MMPLQTDAGSEPNEELATGQTPDQQTPVTDQIAIDDTGIEQSTLLGEVEPPTDQEQDSSPVAAPLPPNPPPPAVSLDIDKVRQYVGLPGSLQAPSAITPSLPSAFEQVPDEDVKGITTKVPISLYNKLKAKVEADATTLHAVTLEYFLNYERNLAAVEQYAALQTNLSKAVAETLRLTLENDQLRQRLQDQPTDNRAIDDLTAENQRLTNELGIVHGLLNTASQHVAANDQMLQRTIEQYRESAEARQTAYPAPIAQTSQLIEAHQQALTDQAQAYQVLIDAIIVKAASQPTGEVLIPIRERTKAYRKIAADLFDEAFNS